MIEVINSKNFVATKTISAVDSTGKSVDVVTLYGGIELDTIFAIFKVTPFIGVLPIISLY